MDLKMFKSELYALLNKHDVSIDFCFDDGTDTHGIYDGHIAVVERNGNEHRISDNWAVDGGDLDG